MSIPALAGELQALADDVVKVFEADKQFRKDVELKAAMTIKNPFA